MEAREAQNRVAGLATMVVVVALLLATFPATAPGVSTAAEAQALFGDELLDQDYVMHTAKITTKRRCRWLKRPLQRSPAARSGVVALPVLPSWPADVGRR